MYSRTIVVREASKSAQQSPPAPSGLSPLLARILDQLSVTAWLPAALAVANTYIVVGLYLTRTSPKSSPLAALKVVVSALDKKPVGIIIAILLGLVIATLVAQSFEFIAIRILEGYWSGSTLAAFPYAVTISVQRSQLKYLIWRTDRLERKAFESAVASVVLVHKDRPELGAAIVHVGLSEPTDVLEESLVNEAETYFEQKQWFDFVAPRLRHRITLLDSRIEDYPPSESRIMPTRLGNILRSGEDRLIGDVAGSKLRGYVIRNLEKISPLLLSEHDQYRNRLDMYAVLSIVSIGLAVENALALPGVLNRSIAFWVAGAFLLLGVLSYKGAQSAAKDYRTVLASIDDAIVNT